MKNISLSDTLSPTVIIAALVIAVIAFLANSSQRPSFLANLRIDMIVILVLGMMMCTSGIGKISVANAWGSPLAIFGYILGLLILVISASVIFNFRLPLVPNDFNTLIVVAVLIGTKVIVSIIHTLILMRQ